eukprot:TRINITY_DN13656_c1_g1_i1.p1 TRINITY_DN13656_c1_g1~~TRINITY_DN13656_c1_g1_i1.p1  ORF type:complete len:1087 (+),score=224.95 TRINITY_DN13656_c1_g1_i1:109-3369(+)
MEEVEVEEDLAVIGQDNLPEPEAFESEIDIVPSTDAAEQNVSGQGDEEDPQQTTGQVIVTDVFNDLFLPEEQTEALMKAWQLIITSSSREGVAELLYGAWFGASPSLEHLFVKPRAISAMNLFTGINMLISSLTDSVKLKTHVTTLGYNHMYLDITEPRVHIIRDAFLDALVTELSGRLTSEAAGAAVSLFNYIGGAQIYLKIQYHDRMKTLLDSWKLANDEETNAERMASASMEMQNQQHESEKQHHSKDQVASQVANQNIPTTFKEMFQFNSAVMGFGQNLWMSEVLNSFDNIVSNFSNLGRVQEECCVLTVRMAKVITGKVHLPDFQSCMLASLRSLLPKVWTTDHEITWSWCWSVVEKLLLENLGKTNIWEAAVVRMVESIDEASGFQMRSDLYERFFALSPAGEAHFKQNVTYLHLLVTKIIVLTISMFKEPAMAVDEISAVGLRHVGYGIPTELFQPYADTMTGVFRDMGSETTAVTGFSWALSLVAQMMERTIMEGSTIVMKAINMNSPKALLSAISCAARGERAQWMLLITVGTRDISPFLWAVQSGAVETGLAMLEDLLTIRADRDKYYYEADYLFKRHHNIVQVFLEDAPVLLEPLLEGLIWRSRVTTNGFRRVNYYFKHLLVGPNGNFAETLQWVVGAKDPKVMVHPVLVSLGDKVWDGVACRAFIQKKTWLIFTLILFVVSQSVLKSMAATNASSSTLRYTTFVARVVIYLFSLTPMLFQHVGRLIDSYWKRDLVKLYRFCYVPTFLMHWQETCSLVLMATLSAMLCTEPILFCIQDEDAELFTEWCSAADDVRTAYSICCMVATILYFALLRDLAVFSNHVSAYVLVAGRTLSEVALFLLAMFCVLMTLSSALSCLEHDLTHFNSIPSGFMSLWEMLLNMYSDVNFDLLREEVVVLLGVYVYLLIAAIFLFNLLIAQLAVSYRDIYADMVGYARLKRSQTIVETMPSVSSKRWEAFRNSLSLDEKIEFNEGDIGIAGGIQVLEAAGLHPTTVDIIKRVGGTTSVTAPWPEDVTTSEGEDRFASLEALAKRVLDQLTGSRYKTGSNLGSSIGESVAGSQAASQPVSGAGSETVA